MKNGSVFRRVSNIISSVVQGLGESGKFLKILSAKLGGQIRTRSLVSLFEKGVVLATTENEEFQVCAIE